MTRSLKHKPFPLALGTALLVSLALTAVPANATCSQTPGLASVTAPSLGDGGAQGREILPVGGKRTLSFSETIGRVEVNREDVLSVSAPNSRSISLQGAAEGNVTVTIFARDGALLSEMHFSVLPDTPYQPVGADFPLAGQKVVAVDVQFAAVSSSTLKALGFNFSKLTGDVQGAVVSAGSLNKATFSNTGLSLDSNAPIQSAFNLFLSAPNRGIGAVLSTLSSNGLSQMLAQPTLLARSGEDACFLAGGEFPVPVPQNSNGGSTTISIDYKEFGIRLSVTPYVLSADNIVLKLAPEVSELDYNNGVQLQGYVVPGIRRRSAETTVELGSGQSFVIAGLNYDNSSVVKDKVPLLGDIPILGALFKRQETMTERQELIIVATPRLVDPLHPDDVPPLPGADSIPQPTYGELILGNDGVEQAVAEFGVVRH